MIIVMVLTNMEVYIIINVALINETFILFPGREFFLKPSAKSVYHFFYIVI